MAFVRRTPVAGVVGLLVACLAAPLQGGTIRHDRADGAYRAYGTMFGSVGKVSGTFPGGGGLSASGVLIAPDLVLTAAHVAEGTQSLQFRLPELGGSYEATGVLIHPGWNGDVLNGSDLSVFRLDRPVTEVAPASRFRGWWDLNRPMATAGYGITGTGLTGFTGPVSAIRRAGTNHVDRRMRGTMLLTDFDAPHYRASGAVLGSTTPQNLEYSIAPGDSGGGLFVWANRRWQLVGINSFIMSYDGDPDATYGDTSGFTRTRVFQAWVDGIIAGTIRLGSFDQLGNAPAPFGALAAGGVARAAVVALPEPASVALLVLGAVLLPRRR